MICYGHNFEPRFNLDGWLFAADVEGEAAQQEAERIHRECNLQTNLVFCGCLPLKFQPEREFVGLNEPNGGQIWIQDHTDLLILGPNSHPADAARLCELGSHSMTLEQDELEGIYQMIAAVHEAAPLSPIIVNSASFIARFINRIDLNTAKKVLSIIDDHGAHGTENYAEADWEYRDQGGAATLLVKEQQLHLWWD